MNDLWINFFLGLLYALLGFLFRIKGSTINPIINLDVVSFDYFFLNSKSLYIR